MRVQLSKAVVFAVKLHIPTIFFNLRSNLPRLESGASEHDVVKAAFAEIIELRQQHDRVLREKDVFKDQIARREYLRNMMADYAN